MHGSFVDRICRTAMGRARAWLRMALMQKKLADYLKVLIDHKEDILSEYFEPDALMMSEEAIVIMGLLVGLNVIDCNFCVKVSLSTQTVRDKKQVYIELNVANRRKTSIVNKGWSIFHCICGTAITYPANPRTTSWKTTTWRPCSIRKITSRSWTDIWSNY